MPRRRPGPRRAGVLVAALVLVVAGGVIGLRGAGGLLSDARAQRWEPDLNPADDRASAALAASLSRLPGVVEVEVEDPDLGYLTVLVEPGDDEVAVLVDGVCRAAPRVWGGWFDPDDAGATCTVRVAG